MPVIAIKDAAAYYAKDGPLAKQMQVAVLKGLYSAALRGKQLLVTREIPSKTPPPVDKGIYKAGWQVEKLPKGAALYNAVPYAAAIEEGVPAGNVVLSYKFQTMLAEWVMRHGGGRTAAPLVAGSGGGGQRPAVNYTGVARDPAVTRLQSANPAAWASAGAIMHALKKRGIFNRGRGLQVLSMFVKNGMPGVIREEVEKAMKAAVGK